MDPARIQALIATCEGITRDASSFVTELNGLVFRSRNTELDLVVLEGQTSTLVSAADKLHRWILDDSNKLSASELDPVSKCVNSCEILASALKNAVSNAPKGSERPNIFRRAGAIFTRSEINRYAKALEQQGNALNLLLQDVHV
jgi:hypothetical protein